MDEMIQAVTLVAELREEITEKIKQGRLPEQKLLDTIAGLLEEMASALQLKLKNKEWEKFYRNIRSGYIPIDLCERLQHWENEALQLIRQDMDEGICNICKKRVKYMPVSECFREQQKKYGFPYWNAVFESLSRKHRTCPECLSMDRDRMISLFLDMLSAETGKRLKVLHIAPSKALERYLAERDDIEYETIDLYMQNVSFQVDIQDMPMINDETYDIVICSHILEHVEDDRRAMLELKRVLKETGVCIFLVPLVIGADKTDEALGLSSDDNWRRFGQDDHVRLYGKEDFLKRLIQAGYQVRILKADYFDKEIWKQNGLSDIHCLYVASKKDIGFGVEPYQVKEYGEEELVSVIIPTYNRESLIERSVNSVLRQTYQHLEVIIVDDASTDRTEEVVRKIEDERVRYIRLEKKEGANHARNIGVRSACGKYVAFNDSDDEWLPTKLEKQMKLMMQSAQDVGCVYCLMTRYDDRHTIVRELETVPDMEDVGENAVGDLFRFMQGYTFISTQTLLLKKEAIEEAGYFNERLKRMQEWEMLLRVAWKWKFTLVQEKLVNAYVQGDRITTNAEALMDTVRYVIELYDLSRSNVKAYAGLILKGVGVLKSTSLQEAYVEKVIADIKKDDIFSEEKIKEFHEELMTNVFDKKRKDSAWSAEDTLWQKSSKHIQTIAEQNNRMLNEILWAQVFNSSRNGYPWLPSDIALWPGRWAVGYQYMYVVSRLLDTVHPKNILETGLGQSTRLTGSYVRYMSERCSCRHLVIEHDQNWIDAFRQDFSLSDATQIILRKLGAANLGGSDRDSLSFVYMDLDEVIKGQKFDFISLDGPYGTNVPAGYSRADILAYLPDCLEENFCIVLDDYERNGEKNTVKCIQEIMTEHHIEYFETVYRGTQDLYLLASKEWKFLCTL